jgi:hypothetical protein
LPHVLAIGAVARHFGLPPWKIRRLFERGFLPEPRRVGAYRVIPARDLPKIEAALRRAAYLPTQERQAVPSDTLPTDPLPNSEVTQNDRHPKRKA